MLISRATWKHESAEERGVVPGYPFKSLEFLSTGFPAEKAPRYVPFINVLS
jgi:hypothetical protein